jgi:hypothetical protein
MFEIAPIRQVWMMIAAETEMFKLSENLTSI